MATTALATISIGCLYNPFMIKEIVNLSNKFKQFYRIGLKLKLQVNVLMEALYQTVIILKYDHANLYAQNDNESANANTTV